MTDSTSTAVAERRLARLGGHIRSRGGAGAVASNATASFGRKDTVMEPSLFDADRRALECTSELEREAWLRYTTSARPGEDEGSYVVDPADIEGELPQWLCGSFYRSGPGLFEVGGQRVHMADGDGYVLKLDVRGGRMHACGRYIETSDYLEERAADRILYRPSYGNSNAIGDGILDTLKKNVATLRWKTTGNTNCLLWAGKLLALHEVGAPLVMDPTTLDTVMPTSWDLDGILGKHDCFSAHFTKDLSKKRVVNFGFDMTGGAKRQEGIYDGFPRCGFWELDEALGLIQKHQIDMHQYTIVHDFCITENYIVMMMPPVKVTMGGLYYMLGWGVDETMGHDRGPDATCVIYVIPRKPPCGTGAVNKDCATVYKCVNLWPNHHSNAWETPEGDIVMDSVMYETKNKTWHERGPFELPPTELVRYTLPHSQHAHGRTNNCHSWKENTRSMPVARHEVLYHTDCEMPIINPEYCMRENRFLYLVDLQCVEATAEEATYAGRSTKFGPALNVAPWSGIVKLDLKTRAIQAFRPGGFCGEVAFVPTPLSEGGTGAEDDGLLLCLVFNPVELRTYFTIFDAKDIAKGPVVRVRLRSHVPFSFHVNWEAYHGPADL